MKRRSAAVLAAALLLAGGGTTWVVAGGARSRGASEAPAVTADRETAPMASRRRVGTPAYQAVAEHSDRPGADAFMGYVDDYLAALPEETAAHMAREGLTAEETRRLTSIALTAKASLDWDAVEVATGHSIDPNARRYATQAMLDASAQMKTELRAQVAAGADEAARKATIDRIEQAYLDRYFELTGMDADLLDWMLWQYVQERPEEMPEPGDGPVGDTTNQVDRKLGDLPPPPPPPDDAPPPPTPTPSAE